MGELPKNNNTPSELTPPIDPTEGDKYLDLTPEQENAIDRLVDHQAQNYAQARAQILGELPVKKETSPESSETISSRPKVKSKRKRPVDRSRQALIERDRLSGGGKPFPFGNKGIDDPEINYTGRGQEKLRRAEELRNAAIEEDPESPNL